MPTFRMQPAIRSPDLVVRRAACDGCDAPRPVEEHTCEHALWLVTEGVFVLRDRRGRRVADPTCGVLLAPDQPFTIRHPAGPDICIALRGPLIDALAACHERTLQLDAAAHARVLSAIAACRRGGDPLAIAEAVTELAPEPLPARGDRDLAAALAHALRVSFAEATSLGELAASAGTSVFHACRVFRRVTGHTLHGFRRELRLRHALAMLLDGEAPLADIAAHTGFASQSHLTNLFRARFRTTPGRVRATRRLR